MFEPAAKHGIARTLGAIDLARGREEAFREQHPEALKTLTEIARIQSTEASNAIERITAPHQRIRALVAEKTTPRDRAEEEIAGYRAVLDMIHASAQNVPFKPTVVEQLHRDLYQFTGLPPARCESAAPSRIIRLAAAIVASPPRASWEIASVARVRTSYSARLSSDTTASGTPKSNK